jgi:hypothetical protein
MSPYPPAGLRPAGARTLPGRGLLAGRAERIDGSPADKAFLRATVVEEPLAGGVRMFLPLLDGSDEVGVLAPRSRWPESRRRARNCRRHRHHGYFCRRPIRPLDGGCWPRSADPVAELPGLILALQGPGPPGDHGPVTHLLLPAPYIRLGQSATPAAYRGNGGSDRHPRVWLSRFNSSGNPRRQPDHTARAATGARAGTPSRPG